MNVLDGEVKEVWGLELLFGQEYGESYLCCEVSSSWWFGFLC